MAYGGTQSCIFGLVVAFVVQLIVTLGLAELASAFPVRSACGTYDLSTDNVTVKWWPVPFLLHPQPGLHEAV